MPTADARKHTVDAADDAPSRASLLRLSLSVRDPIPVASFTARTQLIADLAAVSVVPSTSNPIVVFRADAGAGREHEYTVDGTTWRTMHGGSGTWTDVTPAAGWGTPASFQLPAAGTTGGMGKLAAGRIQRASGTQDFIAGTDVVLVAEIPIIPTRSIEVPTVLHIGSGVPVLGRMTLLAVTGQLLVRTAVNASMSAGAASVVIVPPMEWPL